jgi:hypothetical protein
MTALAMTACTTPPRGDIDYARQLPMNAIIWKEINRFTFDDESSLREARITNGKWTVRNGRLEALDGEERSILLMPCQLDPIRIACDVTCQPNPDGRIGDISILLNKGPDTSYWKDGYLFTTASYYNECSSFYRDGVRFANTEFSPVTPGQTHKVILEKHGGQIRYWLDGKVILEARDPAPLPKGENRWFGLRTYNTRLQVDNLVISTGTLPSTQ